MSSHKNLAKHAAAGALLGGGMLFTAGLGMAGAQPVVTTPDGKVDIAVGDVTILQGVPAEAAAVTAGALCGTAPEEVGALAQQVDSEGVAQTVCAGLPGGDLILAQNASTTEEDQQPSTTDGTDEGAAGAEGDAQAPAGADENAEGSDAASAEARTASPGTNG